MFHVARANALQTNVVGMPLEDAWLVSTSRRASLIATAAYVSRPAPTKDIILCQFTYSFHCGVWQRAHIPCASGHSFVMIPPFQLPTDGCRTQQSVYGGARARNSDGILMSWCVHYGLALALLLTFLVLFVIRRPGKFVSISW